MNFTILKIDFPQKLKKLSKQKRNFFKKTNEEVSLFHYNEFENGQHHVVFNVLDEYQISTKKLGFQHNFSYSSLINFFFIKDKQYIFIEYLNEEFQDIVIKYIEDSTNTRIERVAIDNGYFKKIYNNLDSTIKSINYTTKEDELKSLDYLNQSKFNDLLLRNKIDDMTLLIKDQNHYLKVASTGRISVDNSDEEFLVELIQELINAI